MTQEHVPIYGALRSRRVTIRDLRTAKQRGERWPMLTSYDMYTAEIFDELGVPVLLVGDSAGNNVYAHPDTVPVTLDEMLPLARAVVRATNHALVVCDLPFGTYQVSPEQALETAIRVMKETGVQAVKLEGGVPTAESTRRIVEAGIPVMAHVGFTPQSVNTIGGYRVQGRGDESAAVVEAATAHAEAGAFAIVLEMVAADVAAEVTRTLEVPVVGIGAGPDCDAQVLVWQDMAGLRSGRLPSFVKTYGNIRANLTEAASAFADDVVAGRFPGPEHTYR